MDETWKQHKTHMQALDGFRLEGRVALAVGDEAYNGTVTWDQAWDTIDFRFRGPFGLGGIRIHGDEDRIRVKTSAGEEYLLDDPERDMEAQLGWSLPIHSMRAWILGVPDPDREASETLSDDLLLSLGQAGWTVSYEEYTTTADGTVVPRKVDMEGEGASLRFVIDEWRLGVVD